MSLVSVVSLVAVVADIAGEIHKGDREGLVKIPHIFLAPLPAATLALTIKEVGLFFFRRCALNLAK